MTDAKENRALNIKVAQKLGFKAWYHESIVESLKGWKIVNSNGASATGPSGWPSDDLAWDMFLFVEFRKWSTNLDAAWKLILEVNSSGERLKFLEEIVRKSDSGLSSSDFALEIVKRFLEQKSP